MPRVRRAAGDAPRMDDRVSIVVPHYDDLDRLDLCLASLAAQALPRERVEIVVADNGSPCGEAVLRDRIAGRAALTICRDRGAGPARNAGVAASRHPLLAFIDSEAKSKEDVISTAEQAFDWLLDERMQRLTGQPPSQPLSPPRSGRKPLSAAGRPRISSSIASPSISRSPCVTAWCSSAWSRSTR